MFLFSQQVLCWDILEPSWSQLVVHACRRTETHKHTHQCLETQRHKQHSPKCYTTLQVSRASRSLSSQVHVGSFGGPKIDHVGSKLAHLALCCSSCQHLLNKMPQDAPTYPNLTPKMEPRCPNIAQLGSILGSTQAHLGAMLAYVGVSWDILDHIYDAMFRNC